MSLGLKALAAAAVVAALPASSARANDVRAEGFDTEHMFGFMIGSDVGEAGEREFQSQTGGSLGRDGRRYRAGEQEFELEFVPARNVRIEVGTSFAGHDIAGVAGLDDRHSLDWQGATLDLRYRLLARDSAPFGMTAGVQMQASRIDEVTGARARQYGSAFTLAFDREIVPDLAIAAVNLFYQPEWTRLAGAVETDREATLGAAFALMTRLRPGLVLGGEARYLRHYEGLGAETLLGQALFVGPTAYLQLSERSRLTLSWSMQAWGQAAGRPAGLDLANFERHQARVIYGVNF